MATINKNAEIDRPLIQDMNHSDEIRYKRLPFGILFMEKMGILSAVNPARRKKLYVLLHSYSHQLANLL